MPFTRLRQHLPRLPRQHLPIQTPRRNLQLVGTALAAKGQGRAARLAEAAVPARAGGELGEGLQVGGGRGLLGGVGVGEPDDARGRGVDPGSDEGAAPFPALGALARVRLFFFLRMSSSVWKICALVDRAELTYLGRPTLWAGEVDFVADGAAEAAAGDGVAWGHGLDVFEYEFFYFFFLLIFLFLRKLKGRLANR